MEENERIPILDLDIKSNSDAVSLLFDEISCICCLLSGAAEHCSLLAQTARAKYGENAVSHEVFTHALNLLRDVAGNYAVIRQAEITLLRDLKKEIYAMDPNLYNRIHSWITYDE